MSRSLLAAAALLSLSACQYNKEGVFVAYLPQADDLVCEDSIQENINDADPPEDGTTTNTPWVFEDEATTSDAVVFVQIFESKDGNVVFQIADSTYIGTSEGGVITVEWENTNDSVESAVNNDIGYRYTESDNTTVKNTITLTKNKDTKGYSGNWKSTVSTTIEAEESDAWDGQDPYSYYTVGQINGFIFTWLVGGASNNWDMQDCESDPCFVRVNSTCDGSFNFELVETDLDPEAYEGVKDAGQPNGVF